MRKAYAITIAPCALVLTASALNLLLKDGMYSGAGLAELFFSNDIVNAIAALAFAAITLAARPRQGLYIGIDAANIYIAAPLVLAYGFRPAALIPAAALAIAVFGIVDRLKIEEVLVNEKGPIKGEHIAYLAMTILFSAIFVSRAIAILLKGDARVQESVTAVADLALVAVWLVLATVSVANPDKRVSSLGGIMTSGAALNLCLIVFMLIDGLARKESPRALDLAVIGAMSLVFAVPSFRLLRRRRD
jgi:hypothetical protein